MTSAGGSGCRRCGTCPGCCGWCGRPSRATWWGSWCSGCSARWCRSRCSGSASSSWTRWCARSAWRRQRRGRSLDPARPSCSALELAIALVGEGLARVSALLESLLGDLFANRTSVELMRHAATLDLEQFENAEIYDKLERARRQTVGRIGLFTLLLASLQDADHAGHPGRGAGGVRALAAGAAGRRGAALAPGRDPLRLAGLFAALLLDPRAPPARLPALHRRQRHLGQGAQALRAVGLPGRALRPAVAASSTRPTRRWPCGGAWSPPCSPCVGTLGYYGGLRGHHLSDGHRPPRRRPGCSPSACSPSWPARSGRAGT